MVEVFVREEQREEKHVNSRPAWTSTPDAFDSTLYLMLDFGGVLV